MAKKDDQEKAQRTLVNAQASIREQTKSLDVYRSQVERENTSLAGALGTGNTAEAPAEAEEE